jgi:hypothetical protein
MSLINPDQYSRQILYEAIIAYFGDISLTKILSPEKNYSLYCARVPCLCIENRYIFVIGNSDHYPYGQLNKLSKIPWISFQTRTSKINHPVETWPYQLTESLFGNTKIEQFDENKKGTFYSCSKYPIEIQLINGTYASEGTIKSALETYNTIIYFK